MEGNFRREGANRCDNLTEVTKRGLKVFLQNFTIGFGIRVGIPILLKLKNPSRLSISQLNKEIESITKSGAFNDALRIGSFLGSLTSLHSILHNLSEIYQRRRNDTEENELEHDYKLKSQTTNVLSILSTVIPSLISIIVLRKSFRLMVTLYSATRALQLLVYKLSTTSALNNALNQPLPSYFRYLLKKNHHNHNDNKKENETVTLLDMIKFHFPVAVFTFASAVIMYCYVMRREFLPSSYFKFVLKMGPISSNHLTTARYIADQSYPLPLSELGVLGKLDEYAPKVTCNVLHTRYKSCFWFCSKAWLDTFSKSFYMYLSLNIIAIVVFATRRLITKPVPTLMSVAISVFRSCSFLGSFVFLYQAVCCISQKLPTKRDHKEVYLLAGVISSLSLYLEKPSRWEELSLHTLPHAIDALRQIYDPYFFIFKKGKLGDTLLFTLSMSVILYFYRTSPQLLPQFMQSILNRLLQNPSSIKSRKDVAESPSSSSIPNKLIIS